MSPSLAAARADLTREAILTVLHEAWPRPLGAGLIDQALPDDLARQGKPFGVALYYLTDRGLIAPDGHIANGPQIYRLTADGVDAIESSPLFAVEAARDARMLRLRALTILALEPGSPMGAGLIGRGLTADIDLDRSPRGIERAMAYLVARGLAEPVGSAWNIAAAGLDYLAGSGPQIPGVADPVVWSD